MKKYLLLFGVLLLTPHLTFAGQQNQKPDFSKYINFILEWTSYKYNGEDLPELKVIPHELVQIFSYGDFEYAQAESKGIKLPTVNAYYDAKRKAIYVSDQLDMQDPMTEVTFVHELVHYLQDINGYTKSLDGHLSCTESEAYDVQMLWQKFNNIKPETIMFVYQQSILAATRCMGNKASAFPKSELSKIPQ